MLPPHLVPCTTQRSILLLVNFSITSPSFTLMVPRFSEPNLSFFECSHKLPRRPDHAGLHSQTCQTRDIIGRGSLRVCSMSASVSTAWKIFFVVTIMLCLRSGVLRAVRPTCHPNLVKLWLPRRPPLSSTLLFFVWMLFQATVWIWQEAKISHGCHAEAETAFLMQISLFLAKKCRLRLCQYNKSAKLDRVDHLYLSYKEKLMCKVKIRGKCVRYNRTKLPYEGQ